MEGNVNTQELTEEEKAFYSSLYDDNPEHQERESENDRIKKNIGFQQYLLEHGEYNDDIAADTVNPITVVTNNLGKPIIRTGGHNGRKV